LGGGFVRDAILGGRPSDLDIWLPSNLGAYVSTTAFTDLIRNHTTTTVTSLFIGPGAQEARVIEGGDTEGYGDVNNHWVLEMQENDEFRPDLLPVPRVNFMRSLTPWTGDSQAFFNSLMRSFDLDICMMFVGLMPTDREVRYVIVPQHLAMRALGRQGFTPYAQMNMLYWNQMRLQTTAPARIQTRLEKMYSKYSCRMLYTQEEFIEANAVIPTEDIHATPISLQSFMGLVSRSSFNWMPKPQNTRRLPVNHGISERTVFLLDSLFGDSRSWTNTDGLHGGPWAQVMIGTNDRGA
jgi:hypothetical protein